MASTSDSETSFELPLAVDDRLIAPGSGFEILDGRLITVPPCDPPHGMRQVLLDALLAAHVADEFVAAADLLTRTSRLNDFAPDASIFPRAPDPSTGRRQLEQVAFEILSSETAGDAAHKARELTRRGVRRVLAIDLERERCLEWNRELDGWGFIDSAATIDDPVFAVPLPVAALLAAIRTDDAVARALRARRHAEFVAERVEGHAEGLAEGRALGHVEGRRAQRADDIVAHLVERHLAPTASELAALRAEPELARLDRWLRAAGCCATVADLLATP